MQHFSAFRAIFALHKKHNAMNKYLPVPDRMFQREKKNDKNWVDRQDRRNETKVDIAVLVGAAAIIALIIIAPHIFNPTLFTDNDAIVLIAAAAALFLAGALLVSANYVDNPHVNGGPWWWMW